MRGTFNIDLDLQDGKQQCKPRYSTKNEIDWTDERELLDGW